MKASPLYAAALCLSVAVAVPLQERGEVVTTGITSDLLSKFERFSQWAGASYCKYLVHHAGERINCSQNSGSCPLVEATNAWVTGSFSNIGDSGTSGFIAVDEKNEQIVLSFQGTDPTDLDDWLDDAEFTPVKTSICGSANTTDGCGVHHGFYDSWTDVSTFVLATLKKAKAQYPDYLIVSTGHSLGGAIAAIAAAEIRNAGYTVNLFTFGQPRIGGVDISAYITGQAPSKGDNYRITDYKDGIPRAPPHTIIAYDDVIWEHYSPEYYISVDGYDITSPEIQVIKGTYYTTDAGNGQWSDLLNPLDTVEWAYDVREYHTLYFNKDVSGCEVNTDGMGTYYEPQPNDVKTSSTVVSAQPTSTSTPVSSTVGPGETYTSPISTDLPVSSTVGPGETYTSPISTDLPVSSTVGSGETYTSPISSPVYTTSTAWTTLERTVTSCAPTITDCPASVVTDTIIDYTTICPVTETETPTTSPSPSETLISSTVDTPIPSTSTSPSSTWTVDTLVPVTSTASSSTWALTPISSYVGVPSSPANWTWTSPPQTITTTTEIVYTSTTLCPVTETHVTSSSTNVVTWHSTSTVTLTSTDLITICPKCSHSSTSVSISSTTPVLSSTVPPGARTSSTTPSLSSTVPPGEWTSTSSPPTGLSTTQVESSTVPPGEWSSKTSPPAGLSTTPVTETVTFLTSTIATEIVMTTTSVCFSTSTYVTTGSTSLSTSVSTSTITYTSTSLITVTSCPGGCEHSSIATVTTAVPIEASSSPSGPVVVPQTTVGVPAVGLTSSPAATAIPTLGTGGYNSTSPVISTGLVVPVASPSPSSVTFTGAAVKPSSFAAPIFVAVFGLAAFVLV